MVPSNFSQPLPNPDEFIAHVKGLLLADLHKHLQELKDGQCNKQDLCLLATHLRTRPRLLYSLNCITRPMYRLECPKDAPEVSFLVFVEVERAKIHCLLSSPAGETFPSSEEDIRELLSSPEAWQGVMDRQPPHQWIECLAQMLQELIDSPAIDKDSKPFAQKRLVQLAKQEAIIPLSMYINFGKFDEGSEQSSLEGSGLVKSSLMDSAEFKAFGGGCEVYRVAVGDTALCLRLLHQTQASEIERTRRAFCLEAIVWNQLRHANVAPFLGASLDVFPRRFCFILPWFEHGSIMDFLATNPQHDKASAITQIIHAIGYLHELDPPVIHKDIKGANVLVDQEKNCILSDFGISSILHTQHLSTVKGTPYWMPPETFIPHPTEPLNRDGRPRDVYSLGCTIYEILTGNPPSLIMFSVINKVDPALPPPGDWTLVEKGLWEIVRMCVALEPSQRPIISAIAKSLKAASASGPLTAMAKHHDDSPRLAEPRIYPEMRPKIPRFFVQENPATVWTATDFFAAINKSTKVLQSDIIILLIGLRGTGKSTFINQVAGRNATTVGDDLSSCTQEINVVDCDINGRRIVLVDTPGFNGTNLSDVDVLRLLADWLKQTFEEGIELCGLLYFHRITDNRMAGSSLRLLEMFKNICGTDAYKNVILVTTMWEDMDEEEGVRCEDELRNKYWSTMLTYGARTARLYNTPSSAFEIVSMADGDTRLPVLLQKELVIQKKDLSQTTAGESMFWWLTDMLVVLKKSVKELRKRLKRKDLRGRRELEKKLFEQEKRIQTMGHLITTYSRRSHNA